MTDSRNARAADARVALFCEAPVSLLPDAPRTAHNLRSEQFLGALRRSGVSVLVVYVNRSVTGALRVRRIDDRTACWEVNDTAPGWRMSVRRKLRGEKIRSSVALTLGGAMMARSLAGRIPLWVDFYGDPLIEKIGQDTYYGNQYGTLATRWRLRRILMSADRISVCSESQKSLVVGALLYFGRLDYANFRDPVVNVFHFFADSEPRAASRRVPRPKSSGRTVTLLFNGSVNSWTDVALLSEVLGRVLLLRKNVRFIQFGKNILPPGHLEEFMRFASRNGIGDRAAFLGTVSDTEAEELYRRSDICVSADLDTLETRLGWRTRYISAMQRGLVIVSTLGNDLAGILSAEGVGLFSPAGDQDAFARNLLTLVDNAELRRRMSAKARRYIAEKSRDDSQFLPLLRWIAEPVVLTSERTPLTHLRNVGTYLRWTLAGRLFR